MNDTTQRALENPFQSAIDEFANTKQKLKETQTELEIVRNERDDFDRKLTIMSERYEAFKNMTDEQLKRHATENAWLQAYTQTLRTRLTVIKEIVTEAESESQKYATRLMKGQDVASDEDVAAEIRTAYAERTKTEPADGG